MVRAVCGVQFKDGMKYMDLMFMLCLNEAIDRLAVANSIHWYGHVLRREDGHVLRMALGFEVEAEGKKGRPMRKWKRLIQE